VRVASRYSERMQSEPEVWLRGAVEGYDPLVLPVVHSLLQVREDVARLVATVPPGQVWLRPSGAASIGFHVRHIGGAMDRLLTYARGESLSEEQRAGLQREEDPGSPPPTLAAVAVETDACIERALAQLRDAAPERLLDARRVGRAGLPSTVLGLFVHVAEHSTRHAGQAITTARILKSR
jgi:uncharacterized damage-inducible protein DinB